MASYDDGVEGLKILAKISHRNRGVRGLPFIAVWAEGVWIPALASVRSI